MPERLVWTPAAWSDTVYWQGQDRKTLKRINALIQDAMRQPYAGIGKPEPLRLTRFYRPYPPHCASC